MIKSCLFKFTQLLIDILPKTISLNTTGIMHQVGKDIGVGNLKSKLKVDTWICIAPVHSFCLV